jgi:hypothetical protein
LVRWFGNEARRVYAIMGETEGEQTRRELAEFILLRHGGEIAARDLQRAKRTKYATADEAEAALTDLAEHDFGLWFVDEHDGGRGCPARIFRLHRSGLDAGGCNGKNRATCDINTVFAAKTRIVSHVTGDSGGGRRITDDEVKEIDAKYGAQLRAIAAKLRRNEAAPPQAGKPARYWGFDEAHADNGEGRGG